MSIAVLYESTESQFNTLGLGPLREAESCLVTEERNGIFELSLDYPITGQLFKELKNTRIIKAHAGPTLRDQRFRINRVSKIFTKNGKKYVTIYAEHVSYLTQELAMLPECHIVTLNAYEALRVWKSAILDNNPFTVHSDITTIGSTNWHIREVENPRMALGGVEGSLLDIYGGEYKFDNYTISLLKQRGKKANTIIKYGRNLTDLTQDEYINTTYTSVYPYAIYTDDQQNEKLVTVDGYVVDSEHVNNYPNRKVLPIDFSSEFDQYNLPTKAKLLSFAKTYIKANTVGVPRVSIKLEYIDLSQTLDYKDLVVFEEINLCDELPVYFDEMDIQTTAKVVRVVWNHLMDRYETIELGETKTTLSNVINNIETNINNVQTTVNEVQLAANGKNMVFRGPDKPTAQKVGDQWYKPVGDDTELYIWNGSEWEFVMSTAPDPEIKEAIEELEKVTVKNKEEITKAVEKADQSIEEAGFAKNAADNAKSIANQATENAKQAVKDALEAKEDLKDVQVQITNINGELGQKVNQLTFNQLQGTVSQQGTAITQNKTDIALKASQSEVNTLTGRVSSAESKLTVQSGQISGLVTKTDGQATEIANLTLTANGLNSTVSKVQSDLNNLSIGGRNYIVLEKLNSYTPYNLKPTYSGNVISTKYAATNTTFLTLNITDLIPDANEMYTLSGIMKINGNPIPKDFFVNSIGNTYNTAGNPNPLHKVEDSGYFVFTEKWTGGSNWLLHTRLKTIKAGDVITIEKLKFEKGNKATDWTSAPEDMATKVEYSNLQQTVNGIQTTVAGKADQSQITQLSGQITSVVKDMSQVDLKTRIATGLSLNDDPEFRNGMNDITIYNNAANGAVSVTREKGDYVTSGWSTPTNSGYRLAIKVTGAASPIYGGIVSRFFARINAEFIVKFTALLPIGRQLQPAYNSLGTNSKVTWITDSTGNGTWREYMYHVKCGTGGDFSTFGFLYVMGGTTPTPTTPLTWYVASYETIDITQSNQSQITQLKDMINLKVEKNQIISQINISPENILIESKLIHLSGKSKIDDAVITSAMIANAAITSAKIQDAAISNAKILNVDAGKLTSGFIDSNRIQARTITADKLTANAIQVGFNAMGNTIKLSPTELSFYENGNLSGRLTDAGMEYWYGTRKIGRTGEAFKLGNTSIRGIANQLETTGDFITWEFRGGSISSSGEPVLNPMLTLDPKGKYTGYEGVMVDRDIYLNQNIGVKNATQGLRITSRTINGQNLPSLYNQSLTSGISIGATDLYLVKSSSYYKLSDIVNVTTKLKGLGSIMLPVSIRSDGSIGSYKTIYL